MVSLNFLKIFNKKSLDNSQQIQSMLPPSNLLSLSGGLKSMLGQIYNYFTDDGQSFEHLKTITRARNYAIVDPVVNSYIRIMQNNSIGYTGLTLQARTPDTALNSRFEHLWADYSKAKNFDISGRFSCNDFLFNAISQYIIDGEIVIRKYKNSDSKYGVQYQLLDFESIDFNINKGNIFNGVEVDGYLRPIFYHLKSANGKTRPVPADEIIHVIRPIPGQVGSYRGLSLLAPALPLLKDINTYTKTDLQAAINEATKVISYESDLNYGKAYEGASTASDIANFKPGKPEVTSSLTPERQAELLLLARQNTQIVSGGLGIESLPPGVKLSQLASNHPNPSSVGFVKSHYTKLAAGLGISYMTLMQDLSGANYSGSRATYIAERPTYRKLRAMIIEKILDPIYEEFVTNLINSGKFPEAKRVDNSYDVYFEHDYMGLGWESVDPMKDSKAAIDLMSGGLLAPSTYFAEKGIDLEDYAKQIARDTEILTKYKVKIPGFNTPAETTTPLETEVEDPTETPEEEATDTTETPNEVQEPPVKAKKSRKKSTPVDDDLIYTN